MSSTISVFIADDHPLFRASLERLVSGHPQLSLVGVAEDGRTALDRVCSAPPDVAVIDLRMPELDGIELLYALHEEELTTRVMLLTGHLDPPAVHRAVELGAAAVLSKLVKPSTLIEAIFAVAHGETILSAEVQEIVTDGRWDGHQHRRPVLSAREREVLQRIAEGETVGAMAASMHLSPSTIKSHVENLYRKLDVSDRGAAVASAMRRGLLH